MSDNLHFLRNPRCQKRTRFVQGRVQMEAEHLNARINELASRYRIQFEGIRESLEPLKHTAIDLEPMFRPITLPSQLAKPKKTKATTDPYLESIATLHPELLYSDASPLDFHQITFFSLQDGFEDLLGNPLLDSETIEDFRWKFLCCETKLEALREEVQKLQNRPAGFRGKIDEMIRNWINPPDRILKEYQELLQQKRAFREQLRDEILQNGNLAKQYICNGFAQIATFFQNVEATLPQWNKIANPSDANPLLGQLSLLEAEEYLSFWSHYSIARSLQLHTTLEDNWKYIKAVQNSRRSVELNVMIDWIDKLLHTYETENNLIVAKLVIYDKASDREAILSIS